MAQVRGLGFLHLFTSLYFLHTAKLRVNSHMLYNDTRPLPWGADLYLKSTKRSFFSISLLTQQQHPVGRYSACSFLLLGFEAVWCIQLNNQRCPDLWVHFFLLTKTAPPFTAARNQGQKFPVFDVFQYIQACKWVMKHGTCGICSSIKKGEILNRGKK